MQETLTYLEMTSPHQLRAAQAVQGLTIEPAHHDWRSIRAFQERVAAPHHWTRLGWSESQWRQYLSVARRSHWVLRLYSDVAGVAELEAHPGDEIEIVAFGLLPDHVGKGLGAYALTLTTSIAWASNSMTEHAVQRLWLYTSSLDHRHALANYTSRGFVPYHSSVRDRPDLNPSGSS